MTLSSAPLFLNSWSCYTRYVTEGQFRASHRKEPLEAPIEDPRSQASLPGAPFHSFAKEDALPLQPGVPAFCRFEMRPTSYRFAKVR